jgi:putative ABC transport system permease protein
MPGYFATIRVPIVRGRDLAATDTGDVAPVVVINEAMARRFWPDGNAIGSRIVIRNQPIASEIVGIVRDMKYFGHDAPPEPEMYVPHAQIPVINMTVVVRTRGDPAAMAGHVAQYVHNIDREVPVGRVSTMTQLVDEALAIRVHAPLLIGFAIVGLSRASAAWPYRLPERPADTEIGSNGSARSRRTGTLIGGGEITLGRRDRGRGRAFILAFKAFVFG